MVLTINPRFAPAANNLAWLYTEHGGDKGKALQLAQTAKEVAPDDPNVSDTPVVQYPLGLASLKVGDKESARTASTAAGSSSTTFAGKEATKALAELR